MPLTTERAAAIARGWQGKRVLVLGDVVADEQVVGRPHSIARDAPVLVLQHLETRLLPGGATNVAANCAALGAHVELCGVVGADETGRRLVEALSAAGLGCDGLVVDEARPTTTKTRIYAGGAQQTVQQQVLRLDRVDRRPVRGEVSRRLAAYLEAAIPHVDALMISDYENGVIHPGVIQASLPLALRHDRLVAVDSHGDLTRFRGATVFTPNQPEAEATLDRTLDTREALDAGGAQLLRALGARAVLITRGQEGMALYQAGANPVHLPAPAIPALDPNGAGDTVAAAFTLALAAGATGLEAAHLSNAAAAVVVARVGTATATVEDVLAELERERA